MKTKLLKKVRKRYTWKWHEPSKQFIIVDRKNNSTMCGKSDKASILFAYELIGMMTGVDREIKVHKRNKKPLRG